MKALLLPKRLKGIELPPLPLENPGYRPMSTVSVRNLLKRSYLLLKTKQIALTVRNIKSGTITSNTHKVITTYNGMQ